MNKEEIIVAVREYLKDDSDNYAILINGPWGSGKTYLYENYLVDSINCFEVGKNNRKTAVYLSLYGIESIQELSHQLVNCYVAYSKMNLNDDTKRIYDKTGRIISLLSKTVSISTKFVDINPDEFINGIESLIDIKDLVICFDDLERCEIPINALFGYINNLVEHCNCKVIILADEDNIGRMYANTNVSEKYLTVLMGGRKIVSSKKKDKTNTTDDNNLSITELKRLNERIYSENYIYKDIKEKVVKKTFYYNPDIGCVIKDIADFNVKNKVIKDKGYADFIKKHINEIISYFGETRTNNLRVILYWLNEFEKIYIETQKKDVKPEYMDSILLEFVRYSIWVVVSYKMNKKINTVDNARALYGGEYYTYVYFEEKDYTTVVKIDFIDAWFRRGVKDIDDLNKDFKRIMHKLEQEEMYANKRRKSEGVALTKIKDWYYLEDSQVEDLIKTLLKELNENKYVYDDYSRIIRVLIRLEEVGFDTFNIKQVIDLMVNLVKADSSTQEEGFNRYFDTDDIKKSKYSKQYDNLLSARKERNKELNKLTVNDNGNYRSVRSFCEECAKRENYYLNHKSFTAYVRMEDVISLIKNATAEEVHDIRNVFYNQYHMGNVLEFYEADINDLIHFHEMLNDDKYINLCKGKTYAFAIKLLNDTIEDILNRLGALEDDSE